MDTLEDEILELQGKQSEINNRLQKLQDISLKRKRCENVVDEAICYLHYKPLEDVISIFPAVKSMKEFWIELIRSQHELPLIPDLFSIVRKHASDDICKDRELIIPFMKYGFGNFNGRLEGKYKRASFDKYVPAILDSRPSLIADLRPQPRHAALVASTLRRLPVTKKTAVYLKKFASEDMLNLVGSNNEVALAWASVGGTYSQQHLSNEIKSDHTIMLAFIQNSSDMDTIRLCDDLKKSKEFMLEAVKYNSEYLSQVHHSLDGDEDLLLAALSSPGSCFIYELETIPVSWRSRIVPAAEKVRDELNRHKIFVKLILCSVASTKEDNKSPFALLNQGVETKDHAFLQPIAEFLDVPMGERLSMLNTIRENLAIAGYPWKDCI